MKSWLNTIFLVLLSFLMLSLTRQKENIKIRSGNMEVVVSPNFEMQVSFNGNKEPLALSEGSSGFLETRDLKINEFTLTQSIIEDINDSVGVGKTYILQGIYKQNGYEVEKELKITVYNDFEDLVVVSEKYFNRGKSLHIKKWTENSFVLDYKTDTLMWSFQGSSTNERKDWIRAIVPGYYDRNFMGMNSSDYGGGIPLCDVWRKDAGLAIGHLEMHPLEVSFPTDADYDGKHVKISIQKTFNEELELKKGDELVLPLSFVAAHTGDCFSSLRTYSLLMQKRGIQFPPTEEASYEPIWCAWGYERGFTTDEIIGTLPKVKELGFKWAVIDDGYQQAEGDWMVNAEKFPRGEKQMIELVEKIHSYGLKAKLWYAPLAIDPNSVYLAENRDVLLLNSDWSPRFITWWDAFYMSPSSEKTREHTRSDIRMFMNDWGFDGLKLDGQHMNAVPADYSSGSGLDEPEQAVASLPEFFSLIYDEARSIKKDAVVENCPCGCCVSFFNLATTNQVVSSDALSSWQLRSKGMVYKALVPNTAYYGDHVENTESGNDFASTIGVGGVPGSKFTWPKDNPTAEASYLLTPQKEENMKKWLRIYDEKQLSKGEYLGKLYDIGFDKPETHLIKKNDNFYYAFYADQWKGEIELRGLDRDASYFINDYVNNVDLGEVKGGSAVIDVSFKGKLLIEVRKK